MPPAMQSILAAPHFHDEASAYAYVGARVWPDGRIRPYCGVIARSGPLKVKSNRMGLYKCYACRRLFSVKVGTVMESSHIPLHVCLQAMHLLTSNKKGISAKQLHRTLDITLKSAWFLAHRIREATKETRVLGDVGGPGEIVEADENYAGGKEANKHASKRQPHMHGGKDKAPVVALVERCGRAASYHVAHITAAGVRPLVMGAVSRQSGCTPTTRPCMRPSAGGLRRIKRLCTRPTSTCAAAYIPTAPDRCQPDQERNSWP